MSAWRAAWASASLAVDADEQWNVVLVGSKGADVLEVVVLSGIGHTLAIEETAEDLDGLGEASLSDCRWVEGLPDGLVLGEGVPCSDPDLEAATAQMVQAGQLPGQMDGVVKVIVENEGTDAEALRAVGDSHQRRQR